MMETSYKREIMNEDNFLKKAHKLKAQKVVDDDSSESFTEKKRDKKADRKKQNKMKIPSTKRRSHKSPEQKK